MSKIIAIYLITGPKDKKYVGSSNNLKQRWRQHKSLLKRNKHLCTPLQNSWNKYGEDKFIFSIIEETTQDLLLEKEQYWLDHYKSYEKTNGYNILKIAGSNVGFKHTEETKLKISEASKGRIVSEETRKKHSDRMKLSTVSKDTADIRAEKLKGRKHTEKHKTNISEGLQEAYDSGIRIGAWQNKKFSNSHKKKISQKLKGKPKSEEHCKRLSEARKAYFKRLKENKV